MGLCFASLSRQSPPSSLNIPHTSGKLFFKGWLNAETLTPTKAGFGMMVAIKKLKSDSVQGVQEWQSEINILGRISHPNLAKLLDYCTNGDEFLLVRGRESSL
ncbi:putative serine/threonine-protein kinase PIX13 [Trifolium repens]|nr:putative serine/threonine-protein kinase PIX13 [Trifolium repens]